MIRTLQDALSRGTGTERAFLCPVHDDSNASASVNVIKGLWVCYACGAKGTTDGVLDGDDERFAEEIEHLLGKEKRVYSERWLDQYDAGEPHPYWKGRFSEAAIRAFRLGFDHTVGTPVYPIREPAGWVLGVVRRSLLDHGPKYLYPRGLDKSKLLWNYDAMHARGEVALVEGALDAVACWEAGMYAVAILGSQMSEHQIGLLHRLEPHRVVLALDNDDAGRAALYGRLGREGQHLPGILERLEAEGFNCTVPQWGDLQYKDVAECDLPTRRSLLHT